MQSNDGSRTTLPALESALVDEFRALQAFVILARAERRALTVGDWRALEALLPQKETAQAGLARLEAVRLAALQAWAEASGQTDAAPKLGDLLPRVERSVAHRLASLRDGILSLSTELGELNRGNQALAAAGLERATSLRDFLIGLSQPDEGYRPFRAKVAPAGVALAVEQWA